MTPDEYVSSPEVQAWMDRQLAVAPPLSEDQIEAIRNLLTPPPPRRSTPAADRNRAW